MNTVPKKNSKLSGKLKYFFCKNNGWAVLESFIDMTMTLHMWYFLRMSCKMASEPVMAAMKVTHVDFAYNTPDVLMYSGQLTLVPQSDDVFNCVEKGDATSRQRWDSLLSKCISGALKSCLKCTASHYRPFVVQKNLTGAGIDLQHSGIHSCCFHSSLQNTMKWTIESQAAVFS